MQDYIRRSGAVAKRGVEGEGSADVAVAIDGVNPLLNAAENDGSEC